LFRQFLSFGLAFLCIGFDSPSFQENQTAPSSLISKKNQEDPQASSKASTKNPKIEAILISNKEEKADPSLKGAQINLGLNEKKHKELQEKLIPFLQKELTTETQESIKQTLLDFSSEQKLSFAIGAPLQMDNGVLKILVHQPSEEKLSKKEATPASDPLSTSAKKTLLANENPTLQAIFLLEKDEETNRSLKGVQIKLPCTKKNKRRLQEKISPFIGQELTEKTIGEIKKTILDFYSENSHPLVSVTTPEQVISKGSIKFLVKESVLANIQVKGNRNFKQDLIKDYIQIKKGETFQISKLEKNVSSINHNPFRNTSLILKPGEKIDTTDIELWVFDRRPYRIYGGVDNTGMKTTGPCRFFVGANLGNLWSLDHLLNYQFTSSYHPRKFISHTATYTLPIFYIHFLTIYGGYSRIRPDITIPNLRHNGKGAQASLRYSIPLNPIGKYTHEVNAGCDYKLTNINMNYSGIPLIRNTVNISQLMGKYEGQYNSTKIKVPFAFEFYFSPGRILPHQKNSTFSLLRYRAVNHYVYFILSTSPLFVLNRNCELFFNIRTQIANQNLISTEQYGLGGFYSVRGYGENEVYRDNAVLTNTELRFTPFNIFKGVKNKLQFLLFLDAATGWDVHSIPNVKNQQYLIGVGPGVRYNIENYLTCRLDWGIKLHRTDLEPHANKQKLHFSVIGSF
jgi:hemolysin activation/secretion protein